MKTTLIALAVVALGAIPVAAQQGTTLADPAGGQRTEGPGGRVPNYVDAASGGTINSGAAIANPAGAAAGTVGGGPGIGLGNPGGGPTR